MADETPPLDEARLAEIRERSLNATPGPWKPLGGSIVTAVDEIEVADWISHDDEDVAFITHAREDIPALLAEVDRLRAEHNEAWDLIDRLAEDLADHAPIAHDWLIGDANTWREQHPKTK